MIFRILKVPQGKLSTINR